MVPLVLILAAGALSGLAVAAAARFARWPAVPLTVAAGGTFVAILVWRLLANVWSLNDDFMPAISVGDTVCLIAGGLAPTLAAASNRALARKSLVVAAGAVVAFIVNVVILWSHRRLIVPFPATLRARARLAVPAVLAAVALAGCSGPGQAPASSLPLKQVQDIALPGGATRLDYQSIDAAAHRLYIAHLGDGTVEAVDLDKAAVAGTVPDVPSAHGVTVAPDRHTLLAAASGTNEVALIDTSTLKITGRVKSGNLPDGIAYDPVHGKAFVSNEHDHALTVIDLDTDKALPPIETGGETGHVIYDPSSAKVFVNAQGSGELLTIDPATDTITDRLKVDGCDGPHGLSIDGPGQLAFIACEGNAKLFVLDLRSKEFTAHFDTGDTPDVLALDAGLRRLYLAAEDGTVSVFDEHDRTLTSVASAKLADHAHTVAVDQATHKVYFPLQDINGHPVLRIMEPAT